MTPNIKNEDYWVVEINGRRQVVQVAVLGDNSTVRLYPCGDEDGWRIGADHFELIWVRRIRLGKARARF